MGVIVGPRPGGGGGGPETDPNAVRLTGDQTVAGVKTWSGRQSYRGGQPHVDPYAFGAIADGNTHPLSQVYGSLATAQAAYPLTHAAYGITSLSLEIDWAACEEAYLTFLSAGDPATVHRNALTKVYFAPGTYWLGNATIAKPLTITGLNGIDFGGAGRQATIFKTSAVGLEDLIRIEGVGYAYFHDFGISCGGGEQITNVIRMVSPATIARKVVSVSVERVGIGNTRYVNGFNIGDSTLQCDGIRLRDVSVTGQAVCRSVWDLVADGSSTVTSATAAFTGADVGKRLSAASGTSLPAGRTITTVNSATSVTLSDTVPAGTYAVQIEDATWWQAGILIGTGGPGNVLDHEMHSSGVSSHVVGVKWEYGNGQWSGGQFANNGTDFYLGTPGGQFSIGGFRSEGAGRLLQSGGPSTVGMLLRLHDIKWSSNNVHADGYWIDYKYPTLEVENVHCQATTRSDAVQAAGAVPTPTISSVTTSSTGGTLGAGTYSYRVVATTINGANRTLPSVAESVVVASGTTNSNTINWGAVAGATGYRIYGRTAGSELFIAQVGAVTSYVDTGSITPAGALPTIDTTTVSPVRVRLSANVLSVCSVTNMVTPAPTIRHAVSTVPVSKLTVDGYLVSIPSSSITSQPASSYYIRHTGSVPGLIVEGAVGTNSVIEARDGNDAIQVAVKADARITMGQNEDSGVRRAQLSRQAAVVLEALRSGGSLGDLHLRALFLDAANALIGSIASAPVDGTTTASGYTPVTGDFLVRTDAPNDPGGVLYVCTDGATRIWRPATDSLGNFTTAGRPAASSSGPTKNTGKHYYDTTLARALWSSGAAWVDSAGFESLGVALGDETTTITTGLAKVVIHMPWAMNVTEVIAEVNTVSSSGDVTVDINEGAGAGTSILSTKLTIDANEETSLTAATPAVISDTSLAKGARITFDVDTAGTGAKGLKVWLIGTRA